MNDLCLTHELLILLDFAVLFLVGKHSYTGSTNGQVPRPLCGCPAIKPMQ
jgi:hypothetical protein